MTDDACCNVSGCREMQEAQGSRSRRSTNSKRKRNEQDKGGKSANVYIGNRSPAMPSVIHYAPTSSCANLANASTSFLFTSSSSHSQQCLTSSSCLCLGSGSVTEDDTGRQVYQQHLSHGNQSLELSTSSTSEPSQAGAPQIRLATFTRPFVAPESPLDAEPPGLWINSPPSMFAANMPSHQHVSEGRSARVGAEDDVCESYVLVDKSNFEDRDDCPKDDAPFRFLDLPVEIRELVYPHILSPRIKPITETHHSLIYDLSIMQTCKLISAEARQIFRRQSMFVSIETPWVQAEQHAEVEGCVPIIAREAMADAFTDVHFRVVIEAPEMMHNGGLTKFIIRLDDLERFCRMWYYSDLTHMLNSHLALKLIVSDPEKLFPELDNDAELKHRLPKWAQAQVFGPFGMIKNLYSVKVQGECYPDLVRQMKEQMSIPYDSPEKCLDEADRLKKLGNDQLKLGNFETALKLYVEAFAAIHILVDGRKRRICGDAFFEKDLRGGSYSGQPGGIVRMVIRIKLVANTIQAYLKMELWEEAQYWGMRSISLMRQALGGSVDLPRPAFPAAAEWGKIYYRTGIASKHLDRMSEARELLRIAGQWLPHDEIIQKEIAATALRLG